MNLINLNTKVERGFLYYSLCSSWLALRVKIRNEFKLESSDKVSAVDNNGRQW